MIITGISDEAGSTIEKQIQAHKELGWNYLELRLINGKNIAGELSDDEFQKVVGAIQENDMRVSGFASAIGNWSRPITGDFKLDVDDLKCSISRMKCLGAKYIRIMSWTEEDVTESEWRKEAVCRCRELAKMAEDAGIVLAHENCTGWGGLGARQMVELYEEVNSPAFKLLYDIGNTISHGYNPEDFFDIIRHNFAYLHIKDAFKNPDGGKSQNYAYCGEGDAMLEVILDKIINEDGYDGFISIEPHVAAIVHLAGAQVSEEEKYCSYIKYGKKFLKIMKRTLKNG